ncbi:hypothetical protein AB0M48_37250 [Lentzea sp. NPDC051208]|uniref:hypothetical protein n=1 Tax=Lentzea sp. NPDC051208 TaxID=3154642 RepID=UPI00343E0737
MVDGTGVVAGGVQVVGPWLTVGVGRTDGGAVVGACTGFDDDVGSTVVGGYCGAVDDGGTAVGVTSGLDDVGGSTVVDGASVMVEVGGCGADVVG